MQDKYRKLYNDNFLKTSDVAILKFYYASFKIQQQKGQADVTHFLHSIAKNFPLSQEPSQSQQVQHSNDHSTASYQPSHSLSTGIGSLLSDLFTPNGHGYPGDDNQNDLTLKNKKRKKRSYGRQR